MSIRNLESFFKAKSVAVIGASEREGSVGHVILRNLLTAGFEGAIFPVNPKYRSVQGLAAFPDVAALPQAPEVAIIATPPATVPKLIEELGAKGTRAAVVITAGFGEGGGGRGRELRDQMLRAARPHLLRIIGPNCLGLQIPGIKLNASFGATSALPGKIAFISQSGAMATAIVDWATSRNVGFSQIVSLGDMSDVDFGDMLDLLAADRESSAILLYVEAVTFPRKFMSAARAAARAKPVIVVKSGRFAEGAKAATSHTGALAGADDVYSAAFQRAGLLRVLELEELFDAAEILNTLASPKGESLAILTNGGGAGVLATDSLIEQGGALAPLSAATIERLNAFLPATWSHGNPVDIIGDAPAERYAKSLTTLLDDPKVDAVLALNCPTAIVDSSRVAEAVVEAARGRDKPVLAVWLGGENQREARRAFVEAGIPSYSTPKSGVQAFMYLIRHKRSQEELMATPPSIPEDFEPDKDRVKTLFRKVFSEGREWLSQAEAKDVLAAYRIPTAEAKNARTPEEAAAITETIGAPVVLKILSPEITHKSDVGGVALNVVPKDVEREARAMLERVRAKAPAARIDGVTVEEMISRPEALELILGMSEDAQFGPVLLFGEGGTAVEAIGDKALELPPLDLQLADRLVKRTRIWKRLKGYRGHPAVDFKALGLALVKFSQLVVDFAEIVEIDVNPLLADSKGVIALDARIRLKATEAPPHERLAIKPYPKELEREIEIPGGRKYWLRPIRGEDEPALMRAFYGPPPEEIARRFNVPSATMSHLTAARFTQINYDRQMVFVLTDQRAPGSGDIFGLAGLACDPDNVVGDYAVVVRPELFGQGIGSFLMKTLIEYARARGLQILQGDVLRSNAAMLKLCADFGFEAKADPSSPDLVRTRLILKLT